MTEAGKDVYLTCTRIKGHKKKHIAVCRRCRWQNSCQTYQAYSQPELPMPTQQKKRQQSQLAFRPVLEARQHPDLKNLFGGVIEELKAIRSLLQEPAAKDSGKKRFRTSG